MGDNSALTHLATGRLILEHGIPRHDPFSFTAAGEPWVVYSWLASVISALAERAAGGNGVQMLHAVLTLCLGFLAWRLTRPAGVLAGRIIAVTVVLLVGNSAWPERPLLIGLVLFAVVILAVESEGSPWLVGGAMWLWVNVHGSFPLCVLYLVVRLVGRKLDGTPMGRLPVLARAAVLGTLAGAVNPLGPRLLVFPLDLLSRHDILKRVEEWRSPDFSSSESMLLLAAVLVSLFMAGRRKSFEDGLPVLLFGAAACLAIRNIALASLVVTPVLARSLQGLGTIRGDQRNRLTAVAGTVVLGFAVVVTTVFLQGPAYQLERYPVRQLSWMEARGLLDERVATQDYVGNFLTARRGRKVKVFFDDRFDMYPRSVISDSLVLLDGREGWQRRLKARKVDVVLWRRSLPLAGLLALDPGWRVVRRDKDWVIAVRVGSRSQAIQGIPDAPAPRAGG